MKKTGLVLLSGCICIQLSAQPSSKIWNFNDSVSTVGTVKNIRYVAGIEGKAVLFNGYTSDWTEKGIKLNPASLFIEAWVAPQEYSFNLSAIINQEKDFNRGFFLGINQDGKLTGALSVNGNWLNCMADQPLPQTRWSHVAMAFNESSGIRLFVNGECIRSLPAEGKIDYASDLPFMIGKTQTRQTPTYTEGPTSKGEKTWMRFNGLIDDLHISDQIPLDEELAAKVKKTGKAGMQALPMPQMPSADIREGPFGAYYTRLRYTEGWESLSKTGDYPDIVVRFPDKPIKYIFWRGTGYIPAIVSENNIWMTDQSLEDYGDGQCFEAMGDKQCRYSHVRILESTPARCVIHWRYALAGIQTRSCMKTKPAGVTGQTNTGLFIRMA